MPSPRERADSTGTLAFDNQLRSGHVESPGTPSTMA